METREELLKKVQQYGRSQEKKQKSKEKIDRYKQDLRNAEQRITSISTQLDKHMDLIDFPEVINTKYGTFLLTQNGQGVCIEEVPISEV